ncbi:MAG TPA: hypothetical protein VJB08_03355 [Candidatus Nanoarchaeia archaeon]|nr:hypothetical protein [Candidatus Nanoarchaeia archaeon]
MVTQHSIVIARRRRRYLYSIVLAAIAAAFIAGILFGVSVATQPLDAVAQFVKQSELDSESFLIEQDLLKNLGGEECRLAETRLDYLSKELAGIGRQLSDPEAEQQLGAGNYAYLKTKYHLLQVRTYLFFKKVKESCATPIDVILFYYSNTTDSVEQGYTLDQLVAANPGLHVFAVQSSYAKQIQFLEAFYNITITPSLVINYKYKVTGKAEPNRIGPLLQNG